MCCLEFGQELATFLQGHDSRAIVAAPDPLTSDEDVGHRSPASFLHRKIIHRKPAGASAFYEPPNHPHALRWQVYFLKKGIIMVPAHPIVTFLGMGVICCGWQHNLSRLVTHLCQLCTDGITFLALHIQLSGSVLHAEVVKEVLRLDAKRAACNETGSV